MTDFNQKTHDTDVGSHGGQSRQMMEVFENQEFGSIRVLQEAGKTFFCASDVAKALGYILPSERAFSYKMKLEAMKHQGTRNDLETTSRQVVGKLEAADTIGEQTGESGRQVQRFIRLTNLIPEILDMVDEKKIAFNPAVELSYLKPSEQKEFLEAIDLLIELSCILHVSTDYLLMGSEPSKEEVKNDLLSIISELSTIAKKI